MTYAADTLLEEVAYVARHFHWSLDTILDLEHSDRHRFILSANAEFAEGHQ